ncbi:hypothetical protein CAOG_06698 [Capsaspora owczarzaki ATCC 30864]|uniref:small monomeric GTPase n=1 Tax=Capsaspora owczarzaki (strain ATCC 30864) TaxID=595528 RepID=A0A0D2WUI3_CAPO3|nr:hypothetical protein CAOG_06698 [Capsaspora owczarzaki ATCC 30864]KJE96360.1 hypothetical protein CAOG_006698 [Capsaspora owczarzaki ATCC 30864]|eukprot:XP_004344319.1 hypothetical protein CAOG_06698 [Capsaspora owczarzaki ATCC 30864]
MASISSIAAATKQQRRTSIQDTKIVVMGEGGVGKSCITIQLISNSFDYDYDPTIEDSYRHQCHVDGEVARLDILDTAGQEEFSVMKDQYMRQGHGFVLVYSITNRDSFRQIPRLIEQIRRNGGDTPVDLPIVLVANKCDLEANRVVTMIEGQALAKRHGCDFYESSAALRINIEQCFHQLVRRIRERDRRILAAARAELSKEKQSALKRLISRIFSRQQKNAVKSTKTTGRKNSSLEQAWRRAPIVQ